MAMTRRLLFEAVGAAVLGVVFVGGSRFACRFVPRNHPDFFALLEAAPGDEAALRIGRLALAHAAMPKSLGSLEAALRSQPLIDEAIRTSCPRTRALMVQDQCAADFEAARIVELDGWLLSKTEAAICAAKTLTV